MLPQVFCFVYMLPGQPFRVVEQGNYHVIYTVSHGKFHDRGYSDILYGINSIDLMGCRTPEYTWYTITW